MARDSRREDKRSSRQRARLRGSAHPAKAARRSDRNRADSRGLRRGGGMRDGTQPDLEQLPPDSFGPRRRLKISGKVERNGELLNLRQSRGEEDKSRSGSKLNCDGEEKPGACGSACPCASAPDEVELGLCPDRCSDNIPTK